uniref:(northern house mosquito) hypothetical protein n=1 Tax=Culex pipiens TaxID=7175 RepID=A0A8D8BDE4_CULPI
MVAGGDDRLGKRRSLQDSFARFLTPVLKGSRETFVRVEGTGVVRGHVHFVRFLPSAEEQTHVLPVANVAAKLLLGPEAHPEDERNRPRSERPQIDRADYLTLTVRIKHPVSHVKVRVLVRIVTLLDDDVVPPLGDGLPVVGIVVDSAGVFVLVIVVIVFVTMVGYYGG